MRVLITDPFHPVVPATVAGLKEQARAAGEEWTVLGLTSRTEGARPPALDGLIAGPDRRNPRWQDLVALAGSDRIDLVLPWTDIDAQGITRYADPLAAAGTSVACAPAPLVELAGDKWATTLRLAELGVPVPKTRLVRTAAEVEKAAVDLGYPQAPLLLKPRGLAGGHGVWSIRAGVDLTRTSPRPRLPLDALAAAVAGSEERTEFLLQQELAGTDLSVDVLAHGGRVVAAGVRTRQRTGPSTTRRASAAPPTSPSTRPSGRCGTARNAAGPKPAATR